MCGLGDMWVFRPVYNFQIIVFIDIEVYEDELAMSPCSNCKKYFLCRGCQRIVTLKLYSLREQVGVTFNHSGTNF